jgi:UDP-N-acetylmuramoyl-tripeptide--D-alanyl-D-alanine ligase
MSTRRSLAIDLGFVARAAGGLLSAGAKEDLAVAEVQTDSRAVGPRDLFVALRGERFDGHDFVGRAREAGAAAALVDRECPGADLPLVRVNDTLRALGDLAAAQRARAAIPLVAVTGSNGKTTTKDMCAAILAETGPVLATEGNFNNEIGLPLTLLRLREHHRHAVVEEAMRGPGEIAALTRIARPDVGVITNVAPAHLGRLGSIEAIARAKGELFAHLPPGGRAVFPSGEPLLEAQAAHLPADARLRFGEAPSDDVRIERAEPRGPATDVALRVCGEPVAFVLPLPGAHNVRNAAAAAAAASAVGAGAGAIASGLARVRPSPHRSRVEEVGGRWIYDDCYNANPDSMRAALRAARDLRPDARVVAVLADMMELGDDAAALHAEIGREAARLGVAVLVGAGALAAETVAAARAAGLGAVWHVADALEAATRVAGAARPGDVVLIKGSRAMAMERAVEALRVAWSGGRSPAPGTGA